MEAMAQDVTRRRRKRGVDTWTPESVAGARPRRWLVHRWSSGWAAGSPPGGAGGRPVRGPDGRYELVIEKSVNWKLAGLPSVLTISTPKQTWPSVEFLATRPWAIR